jgi:hypothetical protein
MRRSGKKIAKKKMGHSAPKSKKRPRKLPEDSISRAVQIMREATNQQVGDTADKITRAPKKRR